MKKIILLVLTLLTNGLYGCTNNDMGLAKQFIACEDHGGIYNSQHSIFTFLKCNDGITFQGSDWSQITGNELSEKIKEMRDRQNSTYKNTSQCSK